MRIADTDILEFQNLCRDNLNINLSWQEAHEGAIKLLRVMQISYKPMTLIEYRQMNKKYEDRHEPSRPKKDK